MAKMKTLPKGFTCECGNQNAYDAYVYAHWDTRLTHECKCGRIHSIKRGVAKIIPYGKRSRNES